MDFIYPNKDNKPDLSNLKPIGSKVYIYIPKQKRVQSNKLYTYIEEGIYLYSESSNIYIIYCPNRPLKTRLIRTSYLQFIENTIRGGVNNPNPNPSSISETEEEPSITIEPIPSEDQDIEPWPIEEPIKSSITEPYRPIQVVLPELSEEER